MQAEGRAAEPQQMVAIHPDKLNRFLLQLQTIQAKVNSLQAERVATAQKAKAVEVSPNSSVAISLTAF